MDPVISLQTPLRNFFRRRRFKNFSSDYSNIGTILDVGGEHEMWSLIGRSEGITLLNIRVPKETGGVPYVEGSRCALPFSGKSLALAFFNFALLHVARQGNPVQVSPPTLCGG